MNVIVKGKVLNAYSEYREKAGRYVNFAVVFDGEKDNIIVMDVPSLDIKDKEIEYRCVLYSGQYGVSFKFRSDCLAEADELIPTVNKPNGLK